MEFGAEIDGTEDFFQVNKPEHILILTGDQNTIIIVWIRSRGVLQDIFKVKESQRAGTTKLQNQSIDF